MVVPDGYKQTEVGVIPEDWDARSLGEICRLTQGVQVDLDKQSNSAKNGFVRFLRIENFTQNSDDYRFIDRLLCLSKVVNETDVVVVRYGATAGFIGTGQQGALANNLFKVEPSISGLSKCFLYTYLKCDKTFRYFQASMFGGAMPALSFTIAKALQLPLPPLPEQRAIAEALRDVDSLIASLDALITKKRQIKQGTMQQLLTGKTRLPGFSGEWEETTLGEMFDISAGGDLNKLSFSPFKTDQYCHPIFANGITDGGLYGFSSEYRHEPNAITVTARGTLGVANHRPIKFDAIGRLLVLRPCHPTDCIFVAEYINNRIEFVVESTGVPQLTAPQISKYSVQCPPCDEQTAIAKVLSDMDAEITALEQKRDKTRLIKQGMMQQLLTGKTRLKGIA